GGQATKDVETAQSLLTQAQAEFDRASSRLTAIGGASGKGGARTVTVSAPIAASVVMLTVAPGQFVNDPNAAMMSLSNVDSVLVTANVPENQVGQVQPGQSVDIALPALPNDVLHGTVQSVDNVLSADTRRQKARIVFANADGKLKPNMYATATFLLPQAAQVFVPQSAVLMNNDSTSVFVETAPWTFERRKVELGADEGDSSRVLSGLNAGDRVVTQGGVLIND
ncbi:MAG: efflux RND transporter periplasmic adaptor subunit, partial [Rudaea sp.]|nr:efflux RND transporter periplasmic adaptor subunit [Rudaea sp.]